MSDHIADSGTGGTVAGRGGRVAQFVERVMAEAVAVRPGRVLLALLALPFWLLGVIAGCVIVVAMVAVGAVRAGVADVRGRVGSVG